MTLYGEDAERVGYVMMHELYPDEWDKFEQEEAAKRELQEEAAKESRRRQTVCEPSDENASRVQQFRAALKHLTRGQIFGVEFIKKDGSLRRMCAKLGVRPSNRWKCSKLIDRARNNERFCLLTVFDMNKGDWRTVNLNTLRRLTVSGRVLWDAGLEQALRHDPQAYAAQERAYWNQTYRDLHMPAIGYTPFAHERVWRVESD